MMDEFMKLLKEKAKKQGGPKEGPEMKAKASMAQHLKEILAGDLHDGVKDSIQKVTVASDSEEGIEEGLEKAKDIFSKRSESSKDEKSMSEKALASHESEEKSEGASSLETEIAKLESELEEKKKELEEKKKEHYA